MFMTFKMSNLMNISSIGLCTKTPWDTLNILLLRPHIVEVDITCIILPKDLFSLIFRRKVVAACCKKELPSERQLFLKLQENGPKISNGGAGKLWSALVRQGEEINPHPSSRIDRNT